MLTFGQFRAQFTSNVVDHFLWTDHPYFVLLQTHPTKSVLKEWLIQGGKIEQSFPQLLREALDNKAIPENLKHSIRDNLADETGHGIEAQSHFALYKDALRALEISFSDYESAEVQLATQVLLRGLFDGVSSQDPIEAIARLTTEELLPPVEFPPIVRALMQTGHDPNQDQWEPYFTVHIEGDREHADDQIDNLFRLIDNDKMRLQRAINVQQKHLIEHVAFYDWLMSRAAQEAVQSKQQPQRIG
jgi:pyrroloquinoline quinone (PQQ) biosynthesis protein C